MEWFIREFWLAIIVYCACYTLDFLAVVGDLVSGVRKAKQAGKDRLSVGYRRTVDKLCKYYNSLFSVSVLDCFLMLAVYVFQTKGLLVSFPLFPPATIIVGGYLAFIEFRSVFEKLEDKERARAEQDFSTLSKVLDNDRLKRLIEILNKVEK